MSLHHEVHLEAEICADLAAAGWLFEAGDAARSALISAAVTGKIDVRGFAGVVS
jgi:hypothetical protein